MKQPSNDRRLTWFTFGEDLTVEKVISFGEELYSNTQFSPISNPALSLSGGSSGFNLNGDILQIKNDLSNEIEPDFQTISFKGQIQPKGSFSFHIQFSISINQILLQATNGTQDIFDSLKAFVQDNFPPTLFSNDTYLRESTQRLASILREGEIVAKSNQEANIHLGTINQFHAETKDLAEKTKNEKAEVSRILLEAKKSETELTGHVNQITLALTQATTAKDETKKIRDETSAIEAKIKAFFNDIENNRNSLNKATSDWNVLMKDSKTKTEKIIEDNVSLQKETKEHLIKAVGIGLFNAFETRKQAIIRTKWIWALIAGISTLLQFALILWLASYVGSIDPKTPFYLAPSFILRVTACIPIIFLIGYAIHQYAKERQFEEMYGFKASLSFSLSPYLDLVKQLESNKSSDEHKKFVIETIRQIFENPLQKTMDSKGTDTDKPFVNEVLDKIIKLIETGVRR